MFFHRLSSSGEMLGKVIDYLRLELAVRAHFPFLQWDRGCAQITGVILEVLFMHLCWAVVASFLYPVPGGFSGTVYLLLLVCFGFLCIHLRLTVLVLPTPWGNYTFVILCIIFPPAVSPACFLGA